MKSLCMEAFFRFLGQMHTAFAWGQSMGHASKHKKSAYALFISPCGLSTLQDNPNLLCGTLQAEWQLQAVFLFLLFHIWHM